MSITFTFAFPILVLVCFLCSAAKCDVAGLRFYLYTKQNPTSPDLLSANQNSVVNSHFIRNAPLKFLCHGYTSDYQAEFPQATKTEYLSLASDTNVVAVDWAQLSSAAVPFATASQNARIVGQEIAALINVLVQNGWIQLSSVHFIGHSLGGQVGAFISYNLGNGTKIPRVTGLDPARDGFDTSVDKNQGLDSGDADFVDVIDTSGGGVFSTSSTADPPRGTVDFYPNGGVKQPGCGILGLEYPRLCSHNRAYKFFTESIRSTKGFKSCKCASWAQYTTSGQCACTDSTLMGEPVSTSFYSSTGTYYLKTNANPPFA